MDFSAPPFEDQPYALREASERQRRLAMLQHAHTKPFTEYVTQLRTAHPHREVPDFDPLDGGAEAKILYLIEAPWCRAVASGVVWRNNPALTARNLCELLQEAEIARHETILWNFIPWYVGDSGSLSAAKNEALSYLPALLGLLPHLEVVALVGQKVQALRPLIRRTTSLPLIALHHTSAQVFNVWPQKRTKCALNSATSKPC